MNCKKIYQTILNTCRKTSYVLSLPLGGLLSRLLENWDVASLFIRTISYLLWVFFLSILKRHFSPKPLTRTRSDFMVNYKFVFIENNL